MRREKKIAAILFSLSLFSCGDPETHVVHRNVEDAMTNPQFAPKPIGKALIDELAWQDGKKLFESNCTKCHQYAKRDGFISENILSRIPGGNWRYEFIRNSKKLFDSADPYTIHLYDAYNETEMPGFPDFTKEQIDNLFFFMNDPHRMKRKYRH